MGSETFVVGFQNVQGYGLSAFLSRDGNTAIVGTPTDSFSRGATYIFINSTPGPYTTIQNGNWHDGNTWDSGFVPPSNASVFIRHNIVVTATAHCYSLKVEAGSTVTVNSGILLNVLH